MSNNSGITIKTTSKERVSSYFNISKQLLVEQARAKIIFDGCSVASVLSVFDDDDYYHVLVVGAHTPAAQPTAPARAMLTRALVLRAVILCAALRRAALAEGWGAFSAAGGL